MASTQSIATARERILEALAGCDPLNIIVPPLILALWAGYMSTEGKAYREAFKGLKDDGIIVTSKGHVEFTAFGRTTAPQVEPPSDDSGIQSKLFSILMKTSKNFPLPPQSKSKAIFDQLLDGGPHTKESMAQAAGYKAVDTKAFRNIFGRMKTLGMLEAGPTKGTFQFTELVFPVGGRPNQSTLTASHRCGANTETNKCSKAVPALAATPSLQVDDQAKHSPMPVIPAWKPSSSHSQQASNAPTQSLMPPLSSDTASFSNFIEQVKLTMYPADIPPLGACIGSPSNLKRVVTTPPLQESPPKKHCSRNPAVTQSVTPAGSIPVVSEAEKTPPPSSYKDQDSVHHCKETVVTPTVSESKTNGSDLGASNTGHSKDQSIQGKSTMEPIQIAKPPNSEVSGGSTQFKTKKIRVKKAKKPLTFFWSKKPRV